MEDYPPNSDKSKKPEEEKRVEQVTTSEVIRRKKGLGTRFKGLLFAGDAKSTLQYIIFDVFFPQARDVIADVGKAGIERLVLGDTRRGSRAPSSGPTGYTQYNRYHMGGQPQPAPRNISQRARARHDFDEIILTSRVEAEEVLDRMFDILNRYGSVSVADLYLLTGFPSSHVDNKWGWQNLTGAGVSRIREGYLLDLPQPEPFS